MNSQSKLQETEYVPLEQELKREPSINTKKRKNLKNVGLFALFV